MNKGSIHIRPASFGDLKDVQLCAQQAYTKYVRRIGKDPAPMHADFQSLIAQGWIYVALYRGRFAGYVVFYPEGDHIHLENIAILPDQSGKGIGRALFEFVEQSARHRHIKAIELYTNEAMFENLAMYPKLGYQEINRKRQSGFNRVFFRKEV